MKRLLFRISDTFQISGRGLVIATDVIINEAKVKGINLKIGDTIELCRPNGTHINTTIAGIEFACPVDPKHFLAFLLPSNVLKEDVPAGTEAWSKE